MKIISQLIVASLLVSGLVLFGADAQIYGTTSNLPIANVVGVRNVANQAESNRITQITANGYTGTAYDSSSTVNTFIRVHTNEAVTVVFTGLGIENGDKAFFTTGTDCLTENSPQSVTTNRATFTFSSSGEGLRLCYQFSKADGSIKPYTYYGNIFRLTVAEVTALNGPGGDAWKTAYADSQIKPDLTVVSVGWRVGDFVSYARVLVDDTANGITGGGVSSATCANTNHFSGATDGSVGVRDISAGPKLLGATQVVGSGIAAQRTWQAGGNKYQVCYRRTPVSGVLAASWVVVAQTVTYFSYTADALFSFFPRWIQYDTASFAGKIRAAAVHINDLVYVSVPNGAAVNGLSNGITAGAASGSSATLANQQPQLASFIFYDGKATATGNATAIDSSDVLTVHFTRPIAAVTVTTGTQLDSYIALAGSAAVWATAPGTLTVSTSPSNSGRTLTFTFSGTFTGSVIPTDTTLAAKATITALNSAATTASTTASGLGITDLSKTLATTNAVQANSFVNALRGVINTCGDALYGDGVSSGSNAALVSGNAFKVTAVASGIATIAGTSAINLAGALSLSTATTNTLQSGAAWTTSVSVTTTVGTGVSATAGTFHTNMAGMSITGTGITAGTTIASVTDNANIVLSVAATAAATVTVTIGALSRVQAARATICYGPIGGTKVLEVPINNGVWGAATAAATANADNGLLLVDQFTVTAGQSTTNGATTNGFFSNSVGTATLAINSRFAIPDLSLSESTLLIPIISSTNGLFVIGGHANNKLDEAYGAAATTNCVNGGDSATGAASVGMSADTQVVSLVWGTGTTGVKGCRIDGQSTPATSCLSGISADCFTAFGTPVAAASSSTTAVTPGALTPLTGIIGQTPKNGAGTKSILINVAATAGATPTGGPYEWDMIPSAAAGVTDCYARYAGGGQGIFRTTSATDGTYMAAIGTAAVTEGLFGQFQVAQATGNGFGASTLLGKTVWFYDYANAGQTPARIAAGAYKLCLRNVKGTFTAFSATVFNLREPLFTTFPSRAPTLTAGQAFKFYLKGGQSGDSFNFAGAANCIALTASANTYTSISAAVNAGYSAQVTTTAEATGTVNVGSHTSLCYKASTETGTGAQTLGLNHPDVMSMATDGTNAPSGWTVVVGNIEPTIQSATFSAAGSTADGIQSGDTLTLTFSSAVDSALNAKIQTVGDLLNYFTFTFSNGKSFGASSQGAVATGQNTRTITITFGTPAATGGFTILQADVSGSTVAPTSSLTSSDGHYAALTTSVSIAGSLTAVTATPTLQTSQTVTGGAVASLWKGVTYTVLFSTATVPIQDGDNHQIGDNTGGAHGTCAATTNTGDIAPSSSVSITWNTNAPVWKYSVTPGKVTNAAISCFRFSTARGSSIQGNNAVPFVRVGGTATSAAVKYSNYDTFFLSGEAANVIQFDLLGTVAATYSTTDRFDGYITSSSSKDCTAPLTFGSQTPVTPVVSAQTGNVGTHITIATASGAVPSVNGGSYNLCYNYNAEGIFYATGAVISVVKVQGVFPDFVLEKVTTPIWITGTGIAAGAKTFFTTGTGCDTSADTTASATSSGSLTGQNPSFGSSAILTGLTFNLCYGHTTSAAPSGTAPKAYAKPGFTLTTVAAGDKKQIPTSDGGGANRWLLKANATDVTFGADGGAGLYKAGLQFKFDKSGACAAAGTFETTTISATDSTAPTSSDSTFALDTAFTLKTTVTGATAGKDTYEMCMNDGVNTDATKWYTVKTATVKFHVAELTAVDKSYIVASGTATDTITFTATGNGLNAADTWSITSANWCGTGGLSNKQTSTAVGTDEKSVTFVLNGGLASASSNGDWSLCYKTGDAGVNQRFSTVKVTSVGTLFPNQVLASFAATETRALNWCGSTNQNVDGATLAFTDKSDCTVASVSGAVAFGNASYALPVAAADKTMKTCLRHKSDATTAAYWDMAQGTSLLKSVIAPLLYISEPLVAYSGTNYVKVAHGVATTVIFGTGGTSWDSTVLPTDKIAVIPNGKACTDLNAATGAPTPITSTTVALDTKATCRHQFVITLTENVGIDLPLCWQPVVAGVTSATKKEWAAITATFGQNVRIAAVTAFAPWTLMHNVQQQITFTGNWLDQDDFGSFVASYFTDCSKAWVYEQAVTATAAASNTGTAFYKLPAGTYFLCYYFKGTNSGYKSYLGNQILAVKGVASVAPLFTSTSVGMIGVTKETKFTFISLSTMSGSTLSAKDLVTFTTETDCSASTGTDTTAVFNLTSGALPNSWNPNTNSLPGVPLATGSFITCWNFENSINYNQVGKKGFTAGYYSATFDSSLKATAIKVTTSDVAKVQTVTPNYVIAGVATDIVFGGSLLTAGDIASVMPNSTACSNTTNANFQKLTQTGISAELNAAKWTGLTIGSGGSFPICYQYTQGFPKPAATNPETISAAGLGFESVNVVSISPTHATPTDVTTTSGSTSDTTKITFTGYFGAADPTTSGPMAADQAAFVDRFHNKDCSSVGPRAFQQGGVLANPGAGDVQPLKWTAKTTSEASFNFTDFSGEFFLCIRFAGVGTWYPYRNITFSARRIDSVQARSVAGSAAGTVSTTITFYGQGVRTFDRAAFIFANITAAADRETACIAANTANGQNVTQDAANPIYGAVGSATFKLNGVAGGPTLYNLCYKFGDQVSAAGSKWEILFKTYDGASWKDPVQLEVRIPNGPDAVLGIRQMFSAFVDELATETPDDGANNLIKDVSQPTLLYLNGTGLAAGDAVRLVAKSNATADANCDPGTQATGTDGTTVVFLTKAVWDMSKQSKAPGSASSWAQALGYSQKAFDARFNNGWQLSRAEEVYLATVTGGELSAGTTYVVCYNKARTTFEFTTSITKEVRGNWPRIVDADGAVKSITLYGDGISTNDVGSFVRVDSKTDKCDSAAGSTNAAKAVVLSGSDFTISWTFTDGQGAYYLCYKFAGGKYAPTTAAVFNGPCNATAPCTKDLPHRCGCTCQATACPVGPAPCPAGGFPCATGGCYRSPRLCPRLAIACPTGLTSCGDGSCAKVCPALAGCPLTHIRCQDGSCAAANIDPASTIEPCTFKGKAITATAPLACPSGTTADANTGVCLLSGANAPNYNGCPITKPFLCSDCGCYAKQSDCEGSSLKNSTGYICPRDNQNAPARFGCKCFNIEPISDGLVTLLPNKIRRFIVRASGGITLNIQGASFQNTPDATVAIVALDAGLSDSNNCLLQYRRVPDSINRQRENTAANEYFAGASLGLLLTDALGADCAFAASKQATVTWPGMKQTVPSFYKADSDYSSNLNCLFLFNTADALVASTAGTQGASTRVCTFSKTAKGGSKITPVALYKGSTPSAIVPSKPPAASPGPGPNTTTTSTTSPAPGASSTTATSSAVSVTASLFTVVLVAIIAFAF